MYLSDHKRYRETEVDRERNTGIEKFIDRNIFTLREVD